MSTSRRPGPCGLSLVWGSANTPGPLGINDQGDPDLSTELGDTPGTLGLFDYADQDLPPLATRAGVWVWTPGRTSDGFALSPGQLPICSFTDTKLTAEQLKKVFDSASTDFLKKVADELNTDPERYGLDTRVRRAHFFAQVREEAGSGLEARTENLNYAASVLKSKFSYYADKPAEADEDGYERDPKTKKLKHGANEENIGNKAYASRNGNGDAKSGDGWKYRGRGLIQVTGRWNYAEMSREYAKVYGDKSIDFEANPDLIATFPFMVRSAVCYWLKNKLHKLADNGDKPEHVDRITRVVNFHTDSYKKRRDHFKIAYDALV